MLRCAQLLPINLACLSFGSTVAGFVAGMQNIGFFANFRYANVLQLIWQMTDTDTNMYVYFFPHTCLQRSLNLFCSEIYIQYYYANFYHVDPLENANAGLK